MPPRKDSDDALPPGIVRSKPLPPPPNPLPRVAGEGETEQDRGVTAPGGERDMSDAVLGQPAKPVIAMARGHRRMATPAAAVLWEILRRKQLGGFYFRRQHPMGQFIADFYCDEAALIVEIDGAYHNEPTQQERDQNREAILQANGFDVLRFTNDEIFNQIEKVIATLCEFLGTDMPLVSPQTPHSDTAEPRSFSGSPSPATRGRGLGGGGKNPLSSSLSPRNAGKEPGEGGRITALEKQAKRDDRISVYVDDTFALGVFADVAVSLGLRVGQAITPERLEEIAWAETLRRSREDAYHLLSFRARSEKEVRDKLVRRQYEDDVIENTLAFLREHGFLDDAAFAQAWIRERGAARGKRALAFELRQKGVSADTATELLLETTSETERETARTLAVRRVGERPVDKSREARAKLAAFLQRRGFGWDAIGPVLTELYQSDESGASDTEENAD